MRIIAGSLKGRKLQPPTDDTIRPTSDRTRENIFNLLMHGRFGGENILGQPVVDLCCGTGALGLEAISRGASFCTFIDQSKKALELARGNALHCGVTNQCQFVQADATKLPTTARPAALVFMDAPYAKAITLQAYEGLKKGGWFAPNAWFAVEQPHHTPASELPGAELVAEREYGKTLIRIYDVA